MIEDKELDEIIEKRKELQVRQQPQPKLDFSQRMDEVKVEVLKDAAMTDAEFVNTVKDNLKNAAIGHTKVEQKKAEYAKQQVDFESEKLSAQQLENQNKIAEDVWSNKQKRRQFHFDGVKAIMYFVGIREPMNLPILYFLVFVLTPFFLLSKLFAGTIGVLIAGAADSNRPKAVKGFIWTILGLTTLFSLVALIYLFLKWQGICS